MTLAPFLFSGSGDNVTDHKEIVELHIYPETAYNEYLFSDDMYGEFLQYSEGTDPEKHLLLSPGESFDNFEYKKGFHYVIKATKITIKHAAQKELNIIYEYIETISKKIANLPEVLSENTMEVAPVMITFIPRRSEPRPAYLTKITGESRPRPVTHIEGFNFKQGYTYRLKVQTAISYPPLCYHENFRLLEVMSKYK
ncbi:hypothetical protein [Galbibacter sp.]|uniref:hypothetical protein n=1 Tax=Galbibacter sp. TaxID=2918471 RepID=UPI003A94E125